jgi:hypothetical protein
MSLPFPPIQQSKRLTEFLTEVYRQLKDLANTIPGTGTVTSVSVTSANGFSGTVANDTTTPAITVRTTVTGMIKGNGTALQAATSGVDYVAPTSYQQTFLMMGA